MEEVETETPLHKEVARAFFDHHGVVSQNIDSFNKFLNSYIQEIITEDPIVSEHYQAEPFPIRHEVHFELVTIQRPMKDEGDGQVSDEITPNDCLSRSLTYSADMHARGYIQKLELQSGSWNQIPFDSREIVESKLGTGRKRKQKQPKNLKTREALPEYKKPFFVQIGRIPIMVKSEACRTNEYKSEEQYQRHRECFLDPGGYFIINGRERVLVAQEKLPENRAVVFEVMKNSKFECECEIKSSVENSLRPICALWVRLLKETKRKTKNSLPVSSTIRKKASNDDDSNSSSGDDDDEDFSFFMQRGKQYAPGKQIVIVIPRLTKPIPLALLFRALGFSDVSDIEAFVLQGDTGKFAVQLSQLLQYSLDLWHLFPKQDKALEIIGSLIKELKSDLLKPELRDLGREVINDNVLQNIGTTPDFDLQKGKFICEMTRRVLDVALNRRRFEDRDNLINKRFVLAGSLFLQLFKRLWKRVSNDVQRYIKRKLELGSSYELRSILNPSTITRGFNYAVSTGNWSDKKGAYGVTGCISQELNRCSYVSALSHLRRVTTPTKLHRSVTARQLHLSNWGMICPNETPEGDPVGLVQNFALTTCITVGSKSTPILEFFEENGLVLLEDCNRVNMTNACKVFLNGTWLGVHHAAAEVVTKLRESRRRGLISPEVSIAYNRLNREIDIRTDAGRICRPLLVVENNKLKITDRILKKLRNNEIAWLDLLNIGCVEELDTAEIMNMRIAMWPKDLHDKNAIYTHCEIHPSLILGLSASTIPYPDHNQAPRNTYQSGMAKQSIGMFATNFQFRCDLLSHIMHYPHKPLITTVGADLCKIWDLPAGAECIVACMTMGGYNQEDSVIFNQSSIDRGLLRSSVIQTYTDVETRISARREQDECFERPNKDDCRYLRAGDYGHLDSDGLPAAGIEIKERDPVIGKTILCSGGLKKDVSTFARLNTKGVVRQAFVSTNEDGLRIHKVVVQEKRIPKIGDKFASRHGQKGVVGMVYTQEDMPFTKDGITPDIILNPHAVPSRMTIGHLIEALAGKAACGYGAKDIRKKIDGTAFMTPLTSKSFNDVMAQIGFQKYGNEVLYDGATGMKFETPIFIGVNYYQRLRHMIDDKLNVRNRGAVTQLEGQPKRGLTREGAQRFGEMERDSSISHGAAAFLHERLFTVSDAAWYKVCCTCGHIVSLDPYVSKRHRPVHKCRRCLADGRSPDNLSTIALPKAAKLLFQELISMNIMPRIQTTRDLMTKDKYVKTDKSQIVPPASTSSTVFNIASIIGVNDTSSQDSISTKIQHQVCKTMVVNPLDVIDDVSSAIADNDSLNKGTDIKFKVIPFQ